MGLTKISTAKIRLFFLLILIYPLQNYAQYYNIGQEPASVKWQQIKSENFTVIYPADFGKQALHLANTLQYVREVNSKTLGFKPRHVTIVLHNRTVIANAFSLWAPKRCEFFTCPSQNNYPQDWLEQLATHEYRHIIQMDMLNQGVTKYLGWIFGQQANTIILGLYVPMWFMEGDAVTTETLLTKSGRGRIPSFEMKVRAQVLGYKTFNFDKAVMGSFKDFVPDQYNFGFTMVAGARKKYGPEIWKSAMDNTGRNPWEITPFNKGIKKVSGLSKVQLYKSIYSNLDSLWKIQRDQLTYTQFNSITHDKQKIYTNYKFALYINDSTFIAEKSGNDDIPRFVLFNRKDKEKLIHTPGYYVYESLSIANILNPVYNVFNLFRNGPNTSTTDNISLSKNFMVWAERKFDKRWDVRDWSVIMTHDLTTGKTKQITKKTRYFAPYLFPGAQEIVTVEITEDNVCSLVILNSKTGEVIKKIPAETNGQFQTPCVSEDGKNIAVILFNHKGKSIILIKPGTGQIKSVLEPSFDDISMPVLYKNYLFFNGVYSGIDNVYAVDTLSGKEWQVTSGLYGMGDIDVSPDGKKMLLANYTPSGYQVVEADFDPSKWTPLEKVKNNSVQLYKSLLSQESGLVDSVNIPNKIYPQLKYRKWQHLFNPHSWAPIFIEGQNLTLGEGASIETQNYLNTTLGTLGYIWDRNNQVGKYYANISYRAWYPIFDITYQNGKEVLNDEQGNRQKVNSSDLIFNARVPFTFTSGSFVQTIQPQVSTHYTTFNIPVWLNGALINNLQLMEYHFSASNQVASVLRDMRPTWGQAIDVVYKNTPFGGNHIGIILAGEGSLLFPGFMRHHSFMILGSYQKKTSGIYDDLITYPRGYINQSSDEFSVVSLNYKLPLFYPDMRVGSVLYFQRVKANLFYDYAKGNIYSSSLTPPVKSENSAGVELTTDVNLCRFLWPVDAGVRATCFPSSNKTPYFEFMLNFSLSEF